MFRLFRRRPRPPADPLATYDGYLESVERQGVEVRRSAATLLALRGELGRSEERHERRLAELHERLEQARVKRDARAAEALERDAAQVQRLLESTREALAKATVDGELLLEAAKRLADELVGLKAERESAAARLTAGTAVTETMKRRSEQVSRLLALDAARDEVERAHALAELYREDAG